jgi:hypothetical protein
MDQTIRIKNAIKTLIQMKKKSIIIRVIIVMKLNQKLGLKTVKD